tara:strand:+ start:213 stop:431 length:219 start_codon:yes stop_codon:yes gene_type:complete
MKLTEKELDLIASDLLIYHEHFLIFEKKIKFPKNTSFEKKLRLFNSIYQTCKVRETNKTKPMKQTNERPIKS